MRWQLREFRIEPGMLEQFHQEWRASVLPLRLERGFSVLGPWFAEGDRFIWIIGHEELEAADEAYYAARSLEPDPARLIAEVRTLLMDDPPAAAT